MLCIKGLKLGIDGRRVDFCGYLPLEQKGGGRSGIAVCLRFIVATASD